MLTISRKKNMNSLDRVPLKTFMYQRNSIIFIIALLVKKLKVSSLDF